MMQYPLLAAVPPPELVSYWSPIQICYTVLSWVPCLVLSCVRFLLNPCWNMMQCLLLAALPSSVLFPYRTFFKYDAIPSPRCLASTCARFLLKAHWNIMQYPLLAALPPLVFISHPILIQVWCDILSSLPCVLQCSFLIEDLSKYDALSSLGCPASYSPLFASYWIPIVIWCYILSSLPCLLLCSFLIKFLLKYDAISFPRCLAHIGNHVKDNGCSMNWLFVLYK